jgi:hypothetical protein
MGAIHLNVDDINIVKTFYWIKKSSLLSWNSQNLLADNICNIR